MAQPKSITPNDRTEPVGPERTRGGTFFTPRVDIFETDDELLLLADVPGAGPDDVELSFEKGELVLHAHPRPRPHAGTPLAAEYEVGDYYRVFTIHESIDSSKIGASCKNGVLTVHLPKAARVKPKRVNVRGE